MSDAGDPARECRRNILNIVERAPDGLESAELKALVSLKLGLSLDEAGLRVDELVDEGFLVANEEVGPLTMDELAPGFRIVDSRNKRVMISSRMGYLERYRETLNRTLREQRMRVEVAFQRWMQWLRLRDAGWYAYQGDQMAAFTKPWGEVARDLSTSIYLAASGSYKNSIETLRNCLENTLDMVIELKGIDISKQEGSGKQQLDKFSKRMYHAASKLGISASSANSYIDWYSCLSRVVHNYLNDFIVGFVDQVSSTEVKGCIDPELCCPFKVQVPSMDSFITPIQCMANPATSKFLEDRFLLWSKAFWVTIKACLALASKVTMDAWLLHENCPGLANKLIRDILMERQEEIFRSLEEYGPVKEKISIQPKWELSDFLQVIRDHLRNFVSVDFILRRMMGDLKPPITGDGSLPSPDGKLITQEELIRDITGNDELDPEKIEDYAGYLQVTVNRRKWYLQ